MPKSLQTRYITRYNSVMPAYEHSHDAVQWQYNELAFRVVAKSGIPDDQYHLGKIILQALEENGETILQIDAATGEQETNASVLKRSKQCAVALRKLGVQKDDVIVLMSPNHLDLTVPIYAGFAIGAPIAPVDRFLGINELKDTFLLAKPKIIFCQSEKIEDVQEALNVAELQARIITFDGGNNVDKLSVLLSQENEDDFAAENFDPADTIAMLVPTSGTTGMPKFAAATHKNFVIMSPYFWSKSTSVPPFESAFMASPLQWLSAILIYICSPMLKFKRIQSTLTVTQEHAYEMINKYRPNFTVISPTMMTTLIKPGDRDKCDFSSFEYVWLGGSAVHSDLIYELKKLIPNATVITVYGMSELTCISFEHKLSSPLHSCGKPMKCLLYRLVDIETGKEINEPNVKGELWLKGPGFFKGYYNNPEATKEVFSEDGWYKSGDMLYRDEHWNYYFVERIKLLLKYRNHQISPVELEAVIRQHPGVLDVAVTGIPDPECGDLPVACVVPRPGHSLTAQEIKDLVKENLTDTKQLRGGVVFLDQLPLTSSTKVHRRKLQEMVRNIKLE